MGQSKVSRSIIVVGAALAAAVVGCSAAPQDSSSNESDSLLTHLTPPPITVPYCHHPTLLGPNDPGVTPGVTCAAPLAAMTQLEASAVATLTAAGCQAPHELQLSCGTRFFHYAMCPLGASSVVDTWITNHQHAPIYKAPPGGTVPPPHGYVYNARYPGADGDICNYCVPEATLGWFYVIWNVDRSTSVIPAYCPINNPQTQCSCMAPNW